MLGRNTSLGVLSGLRAGGNALPELGRSLGLGSASGTAWGAARVAVTISRPMSGRRLSCLLRGIPEELGHGRAPGSSWRTRGTSSHAQARACGGPQGP